MNFAEHDHVHNLLVTTVLFKAATDFHVHILPYPFPLSFLKHKVDFVAEWVSQS